MPKIKSLQLDISGMTCEHCATGIAKKLDMEGIINKDVSYPRASARVAFDPDSISADAIVRHINSIGSYKVTGYRTTDAQDPQDKHLIIIGGGSAAFAATIEARSHDARVTMINDGLPIGGTCVNVGCVPSKNLILAAESMYKANHIPFPGIEGAARLSRFKDLMRQKHDLVADLRRQKYIDVVKDMDMFRLIEGRARLTSPHSVEVNGETIHGSHILLASGARPHIPDIRGLNDVPYLTNEGAFKLDHLPESMIILGGRYIALEMAQMFARLGSRVTLLQRSGRIMPTESNMLTDALTGYLEDEGIRIITGNDFQRIHKNNGNIYVESVVAGKPRTFEAATLVVATGRTPNTHNMGLEENGIRLSTHGAVLTNAFLQTGQPHVYAAGDVLGEHMFVYTAAYEGKLAVNNMFSGNKKAADYSALGWVVFTDPQIAGIGMDERQARQAGIDAESATLPLSYVPRSIAARDTRGFIQLIRNRQNDRLVGARILAPEGSELLMELALAIQFGITVEQIKDMLHPYLTLSEGIKLAAITFSKNVSELSCCAT